MKSRIKPNSKQSYFNSKVSSVNLSFQQISFFATSFLSWCKDNAVMELLFHFCVIAALYTGMSNQNNCLIAIIFILQQDDHKEVYLNLKF